MLVTVLNILADTHGCEGDIAHQFAIGRPDCDKKNKFGARLAFEYTKLLKQNLLYFTCIRKYLSCSIYQNIAMSNQKVQSTVLLLS